MRRFDGASVGIVEMGTSRQHLSIYFPYFTIQSTSLTRVLSSSSILAFAKFINTKWAFTSTNVLMSDRPTLGNIFAMMWINRARILVNWMCRLHYFNDFCALFASFAEKRRENCWKERRLVGAVNCECVCFFVCWQPTIEHKFAWESLLISDSN